MTKPKPIGRLMPTILREDGWAVFICTDVIRRPTFTSSGRAGM